MTSERAGKQAIVWYRSFGRWWWGVQGREFGKSEGGGASRMPAPSCWQSNIPACHIVKSSVWPRKLTEYIITTTYQLRHGCMRRFRQILWHAFYPLIPERSLHLFLFNDAVELCDYVESVIVEWLWIIDGTIVKVYRDPQAMGEMRVCKHMNWPGTEPQAPQWDIEDQKPWPWHAHVLRSPEHQTTTQMSEMCVCMYCVTFR